MQKRWVALVSALGAVCVGVAGFAAMGASPVVNSTVAIVDPYTPAQQATVTSGGALTVTGTVTGVSSGAIANPTSTLTRPADTTAYAQNDLVASSTTAGSVVVPSFAILNTAGGAAIPRLRLFTSVTTGWDGATVRVRLFTAAPTYTNGDNGAYARATGTSASIGRFDVTLTQAADGAVGVGVPLEGNAALVKLASGTAVFWDLQYIGSVAVTPISGQTFTLTAETLN